METCFNPVAGCLFRIITMKRKGYVPLLPRPDLHQTSLPGFTLGPLSSLSYRVIFIMKL